MKVYLTNLNESWIVDRLRKEWYEHNLQLTEKIKESDIVWIIAPGYGKNKKQNLRSKFVICSIYHLEERF